MRHAFDSRQPQNSCRVLLFTAPLDKPAAALAAVVGGVIGPAKAARSCLPQNATLHMLCGKIAAGKSALSVKLAPAEKTLLISEDNWIDQLYRPELKALADYFKRFDG
jgi:hypothetical protein